jgi:tetratricopeptide (TPR) repeat protein
MSPTRASAANPATSASPPKKSVRDAGLQSAPAAKSVRDADHSTQTPRNTGVQTSLPGSDDEGYYTSDEDGAGLGLGLGSAAPKEPSGSGFVNGLIELEKMAPEAQRRPLSPESATLSLRKALEPSTPGRGESSASSATPARPKVKLSEEEMLEATLRLRDLDAKAQAAGAEPRRVMVHFTCSPDMAGSAAEVARHVWPLVNKHCRQRGDVSFELEVSPYVVPEPLTVLPGTQILRLQTLGRCRPFFVAIVGEDYGEVVERPDSSLVEFYPWLKGRRDLSLFDMELSNAMRYQKDGDSPAGLAYIINAPVRGINEVKPRGLREMHALRDDIRASRLRVYEAQSQQAAVHQMAEHICAAIDFEYPSLMAIRKLSKMEVVRNTHLGFLRSEAEAKVEVPRLTVQQQLSAYVGSKQPNLPPIVIASENQHAGATSLLCSWINASKHFKRQSEDQFVFVHFAGLTPGASSSTDILARLTVSLRAFLRESLNRDPMDGSIYKQELPALLLTLHKSGSTAIIVIDGVQYTTDEGQAGKQGSNGGSGSGSAAARVTVLDWLPTELPDSVKLIVSVGSDQSQLFECRRRHWDAISLGALTPEEAGAVCAGLQRRPGGRLLDGDVRLLLMSVEVKPQARANPLFLQLAVALLRDPKRTIPVERIIGADDALQLYEMVLQTLEDRAPEVHPHMTRDVLSLFNLSVHGLTFLEALNVMGVPRTLFDAHFSSFGHVLFLALDDSTCDPPESRRFVPFSLTLRRLVDRKYLSAPELTQRARFLSIEQYEGFIGPGRLTSLPTIEELVTCASDGDFARNSSELAWALIREDAWEHVGTLVGNIAVFTCMWASDLRREMYSIWTVLNDRVDPFQAYWDQLLDLYWSATSGSGEQGAGRVLPLARLASDVGELLLLLGHPQAAKLLALSVELLKKFFGPSAAHPDLARVHYLLGAAHQRDLANKSTECIEAYEASYNNYAKSIGNHIAAVDSVISLGEALIISGRINESLEALRLAKKMLEDLGVADFHPEAARCYNNLGLVAKKTGQLAAAEAYYQKALAIRVESFGEQHPHTALSMRNLGSLCYAMNKKKEAVEHFKKALQIGTGIHGPVHPTNAATHEWLAGILHDMGVETEAKVHAATAAYIREKVALLASQARENNQGRQGLQASDPNIPRPEGVAGAL